MFAMEQLTDPMDYPKVQIGIKEYEIRFSAAAVVKLKKDHNIDLMSGEGIKYVGAEGLEHAALLLSFGIAHDPDKLSKEQILEMVDLGQWADLYVAIQESQKKASDRALKIITAAQEAGRIPKPKPPVIPTEATATLQ